MKRRQKTTPLGAVFGTLSTTPQPARLPALTLLSDGEDAELLVYLVKEEKDIYIGVVVLVCHLASQAQPG